MDSLSDVFGLCRLCLVQEHVNIPIFDDPDNVRQIPLKISSCLPVQVSREDNLPKKICDECSNKLDLCYDFWTSTANAEKTLLSTVEKQNQAPEPAAFQLFKTEPEYVAVPEEETQSQIPEPQVPEPILIKAESEEIEAPPAKRPRQSAAIKAQMHMAPESDDDEVTADQDFNGAEDEVEEEIDDPDVPDMSVDIDEVKPGTSGLNLEIADSKNNLLPKRVVDREEKMGSYYKCLTCLEFFDDLNEVKRHEHQETCKYFCERCSQSLDTKVAIVIHVLEHNIDDKPAPEYACEKCFLKFYNLDEYEQHQKSCYTRVDDGSHQSSDTNCKVLNRDVEADLNKTVSSINSNYQDRKKQNLRTIKRKSDTQGFDSYNISKKYFCNFCNKSFCSQSDFNDHFTTNLEGQQYGCNECGIFFSDRSVLVRHIDIHNSRKPYKCHRCQKSFDTKYNLNRHIRIHTGEKPFKCKVCNKCFAFRSSLNGHIRTHTGEKPFKCTYCGQCFTCRSTLNQHIRTHTDEKPFKCNYCGQCFAQSSTLNKHIRTHTGEKPFKCKVCNKCFTCRSTLNKHIRTHTGEKPFKCKYCGQCFAQSSNLNIHIRTHTGEKPFKCKYCGQCFARSSTLNNHIRTHTDEKPFKRSL